MPLTVRAKHRRRKPIKVRPQKRTVFNDVKKILSDSESYNNLDVLWQLILSHSLVLIRTANQDSMRTDAWRALFLHGNLWTGRAFVLYNPGHRHSVQRHL